MTDGEPELHLPGAPVVSAQERARITSGVRMSIALLTMVALIVAGLTALIIALVSRVFETQTPAVTRDLEWKARRGAIELSKTAELGILVGDPAVIRDAAADYLRSPDVLNVIALSADGTLVFAHGEATDRVRKVTQLPPGQVHALEGRLVSWAPAVIEGAEVGRIAVAMSTSRLRAGDALRRQISLTAIAGGGVAMLLALGFVALYIWPVLRLTQHAFVRLEVTTEQAVEAARLKAQFLANMSHEIRTPMNAVVGLSKLMLNMPLSDKLRRYAEMIDASSRSLLSIINDILDFSKLEAGKYQIVASPCEPAVLVQEVVELLSSKADEKGIDLVYRVAPAVPRLVEVDGDRVRQVLTNLVGNAIKFTERGEVYVQLDAQPVLEGKTELRIRVQDTGPGVAADLLAHIFEAFSQGDGSLVRKHGGTGLGLTISRQMVSLMGGSLGVESEPGKGSVFWFTLPAQVRDATSALRGQATSLGKRVLVSCDNEHARTVLTEHVTAWGMQAVVAALGAETEAALRDSRRAGQSVDLVIVAETRSGPSGARTVEALRASASTPPPIVLLSQARVGAEPTLASPGVSAQLAQPVRMSALYECLSEVLQPGKLRPANNQLRVAARNYRGKRVLVVDDNHMNQFVAAEQLAVFGCSVDQALDGQQALDALAKNDYAVVFMDCQMPVMDGYTATRLIREREGASKHSVIIALTAHALEGERERVIAAGMDDYLTKPLRPQALQQALGRWIESVAPGPESAAPGASSVANDAGLADCSPALLQLFLEQVPVQLEQLDGAIALGEFEDARAYAHKLKGSLLTVGAESLANLAQAVQHAVEQGVTAETETQLSQLIAGVVELEKTVRRELGMRGRARGAGGHG
jgi:signal transduction histidine kinase/CheY-like chemotaxis protein/HPt (histidine-containing phosphotransfer) domain-containing protein